jgi:hypothetical protein
LDFPEIFGTLYAVGGWVLAVELKGRERTPALEVFAGVLLAMGTFYAVNSIYQWFVQGGYPFAQPGYAASPWVPLIVFTQCSPILASIPGTIELARRRHAALWVAIFAAAVVVGVYQNLMPTFEADLVASVMVALPTIAATWAFVAVERGGRAQTESKIGAGSQPPFSTTPASDASGKF